MGGRFFKVPLQNYVQMYIWFSVTASGDGKIKKHKLEESLAKIFQLSPDLMEPVITLLQNFELAIPLSINTLLIPPFIQNKELKKLFSSEHYNFPRKKCAMVFEDDTSTMTSRRTDKILFLVQN